ncbi:MAG: HEAT repeat domain-containing protein, partial [Candidatus Brocadiales bacterium]
MNKLFTFTLLWFLLTAVGNYPSPLLAEVPTGTPSVPSVDIDKWAKQLFSADPATRSSAAISLLGADNQNALPPLINILNRTPIPAAPAEKNSKTPASEKEALISVIKAFGFKADDRAIGPLIELLQDDDPDITQSACETLGNLHSSEAIGRMSANLLNPGFPKHSRILLARALGQTMEQEAVEPLISVLRDTSDAELQDSTTKALRHISDKPYGKNPSEWEDWWAANQNKTREQWLRDVVTKLEVANEQLQEQNTAVEEELAEKSLALLKKAAENKDQKVIIEALGSGYPEVRTSAAKALSQLNNPDTVSALTASLLNDNEGDVRVAAAQSLGELGDENAVEPLLSALKDEDASVRESAARSLANFKGDNVAKSLIAVLEVDGPSSVTIAATDALGQIGSTEAVVPLSRLLSDKEAKIREVAAIALGKIKDPTAANPLINSLRDPEERVRWYAADSLGSIGSSEGVAPLIELLSEDSPRIRESAATALGQIGDERAIEPLVLAMEDADKRVAEEAAEALMSIDIKSYEGMEYLANTFYKHSDYNRASLILEKQINEFSASETHKDKLPGRRLRLAIAYQQQKDWQKASKQYEILLTEHKPQDMVVVVAFVECLKELKQYGRLLELYSRLMEEQPKYASQWWEGRLEVVYTLFEQGNYKKTQQLLDEFQLEDPELGGPRLKRQFVELAE